MNEREELLVQINNSTEAITQIVNKENEYKNIDKKRIDFAKCSGIGMFIFLFFFGFIFGLLLFGRIMGDTGSVIGMFLGVALWFFFKSQTKKYKNMLKQIESEYIQLQSNPSLSWLPMQYRTAHACLKITEYVQNMRASNLKEALNLYEIERHQERVELFTILSGK